MPLDKVAEDMIDRIIAALDGMGVKTQFELANRIANNIGYVVAAPPIVDDYSDALFGRGSDNTLDELAALIRDGEAYRDDRELPPEGMFGIHYGRATRPRIADIVGRPRDAELGAVYKRSFPDPARLRERPRPTKPPGFSDDLEREMDALLGRRTIQMDCEFDFGNGDIRKARVKLTQQPNGEYR